MELYPKCLRIAEEAHSGQKRKFTGEDYINHSINVAESFSDDDYKCVSVLHDAIEDTSLTAKDLLEQDIPEEIVNTILILTKKEYESYLHYITRIKKCRMSVYIKIEDLKDNLKDLKPGTLRDKYELAMEILKNARYQ